MEKIYRGVEIMKAMADGKKLLMINQMYDLVYYLNGRGEINYFEKSDKKRKAHKIGTPLDYVLSQGFVEYRETKE